VLETKEPSVRANVVTRRTYSRPLDEAGTLFETWPQVVDRVISHQKWLWERARKRKLQANHEAELEALRQLILKREVMPAGRTLWLGGTEVAKRREASMFNCSFERIETVHDVVDAYWLLLQGCGVGFEPVVGTLNGFTQPLELEIIRSTKTDGNDKGYEHNREEITEVRWYAEKPATWRITVGDSAEAWAKLPGKLLANKRACKKLIIDFSEIRPAGTRLRSYGWISSGDEQIAKAITAIVDILNRRAGLLLTRIDILDILNHLGATLSSRRSAEICLVPYGDPEWVDFTNAKSDLMTTPHRAQSNNSLLFYHRPSKSELTSILGGMVKNGGSEPGLINGQAALKRAPWFKGLNPCAEILLANKSFCNLTEVDLGKFNGRFAELKEALRLVGRMNYRQTCVDLKDGILQQSWHELNEFLRLTGVGLTGIVRWEGLGNDTMLKELRNAAGLAAYSMADELGMPRTKAITTVKPSGTVSKIMDTTEGLHKPLGKYIFNNVNFSKHDPIVEECRQAGYHVFANPFSEDGMLVRFPVSWDGVYFEDGLHNLETACDQLERYKWLMLNYVEHNASITVSYDPSEIPEIVDWLFENWDTYVGVSFLLRTDPTKTAEDLGYPYLPQEVVTKETYEAYVAGLKPLNIVNSFEEIIEDACATGACPIR
jgi:adenosylcobalamin-dependent ribonucleoside-triphosphate reductase